MLFLVIMVSEKGKRKRVYVSKEDLKKLYGDNCRICGKSEKQAGRLDKAHYKAHSRGGNLVFLLCPNCHVRYDKGLLTSAELKKIGLTKKEYEKYRPITKKSSKAKPDEKYYYLWGDSKKRYLSEATLPMSACRPGRHNWEQSYSFGKWFCTKCKAKRIRT